MADGHSLRGLLHRATHRIPGVAAHAERPAGHQGTAIQGHARRHGAAAHPSPDGRWNHSSDRPARFLPAWQRRVAAFFGKELR